MIDVVIRSNNDTVVVFNEKGDSMPEFQGAYDQVRVKILARAPKGAEFFQVLLTPVLRKEW